MMARDDDDGIIRQGPFKGRRIELAPQVAIEQYEDLIEPFCRKVLYDVVDVDAGLPLLTDLSSLRDFAGVMGTEPDVAELMRRIEDAYGVACDDIDPPLLIAVFARLRLRVP
ncbi:MAG: hypothetical protein AB1505_23620 [Candidatus Latescibacterota bacterium]